MDRLTPIANPSFQHNPTSMFKESTRKDIPGPAPADKVELTTTGPTITQKALLVYEKMVVDALSKSLGQTEKTVDSRLAAYRAQAADGSDDLTPENWTPKRVADRILKFTIGLFELYKMHGETNGLSDEEVLKKFKVLVESSVDKGYSQARAILGDLPEEVSSQLDKTMELVHEGINGWYEERSSKLKEQAVIPAGSEV